MEHDLGELDGQHRELGAVCKISVPRGHLAAYRWVGSGCPPKDRLARCKALIAKAVWDFPTTRKTNTESPVSPPGMTYTTNNLNQYQKIAPSNTVLSYDLDGNLARTASAVNRPPSHPRPRRACDGGLSYVKQLPAGAKQRRPSEVRSGLFRYADSRQVWLVARPMLVRACTRIRPRTRML